MLWTCLHFSDLPLRIFARAGMREIPSVVSTASHRPDVLVANDVAQKRGIVSGMSIAAALGLDSEIAIHLRDECAEAAALKNIALWAGQWTSTIAIEPPANVLLEISGCLNYFGGLSTLLGRIDAGLAAIGFPALVATAPTAPGASLLARAASCPTRGHCSWRRSVITASSSCPHRSRRRKPCSLQSGGWWSSLPDSCMGAARVSPACASISCTRTCRRRRS